MKRIAIAIILILIACTPTEKQEQTSKRTLDNGLRLIMRENPNTGLTAIDFMIKRSPTNDENHALDNFAHRMLLAGTQKRTRDQILEELDDIGASIKAQTYNEFSHIAIITPSNKLSTALEILEDIINNPAFKEEEIEKERKAILQEMKAKHDLPEVEAEELFMKTLYKGHPFEHPPDGYEEEVKQITREDILNKYKQKYTGNNIVIGIAGNIKEKPTLEAIKKLFGKLPQGEPGPPIPTQQKHEARTATKEFTAESFFANEGFITIPATNPDYMPTRVLGAVLGVGSGSRFFYELREKKGLAYTIYVITPSVRNTGFFKITAIVRPDALNTTLEDIAAQLERIKTEPVSEEELTHVKNKMKGFFILDHQRSEDQANYLAFYELQELGYEHDAQYIPKIQAVTSEQIQTMANKYLENPSIAIVGPFEQ